MAGKKKITKYQYDKKDNLVQETLTISDQPNITAYAPASGQKVTTSIGDRVDYAYDKVGRIIKVTSLNGRETVNIYDMGGNLVKQAVKTASFLRRISIRNILRMPGLTPNIPTG